MTYSYQWDRCTSTGTGCTAIFGATTSTYSPTSADVGHDLTVTVTATDSTLGTSAPAKASATSAIRPWPDTKAGTPNQSFGNGGTLQISTDTESGGADIEAAAGTPTGGVVVVNGIYGSTGSTYELAITEYTNAGAPVSTFGTSGTVTLEPPEDPDSVGLGASSVVVLSDGSILIDGFAPSPANNGTFAAAVWKLTPDGALDAGFGDNGVFVNPIEGTDTDSAAADLQVAPDGSLFMAGTSGVTNMTGDVFIAKLTAAGALDTGFGSNGVAVVDAGNFDYGGVAVSGSDLVVASNSLTTGASMVTAVTASSGAQDAAFGNQGTTQLSDIGSVAALASAPDGEIYAAGGAADETAQCPASGGGTQTECFEDGALWALTPSGSVDPNFGNDGLLLQALPSDNANPDATDTGFDGVAVQANGDLVVTGTHQYATASFNQALVARYHADGTPDEGWGQNGVVFGLKDYFPPFGEAPILTANGAIAYFVNGRYVDPAQEPEVSQIDELLGDEGAASAKSLATEFAPELEYDEQEQFFADSVNEAVTDVRPSGDTLSGPLLKNGSGTVLADPLYGETAYAAKHNYTIQGTFKLSLANLGAIYPGAAGAAQPTDYIEEPDNYSSDAAWLHSQPGNANQDYAHVIAGDGYYWIQYWFYYFYNVGVAGFDDHEGDWEGIAVKLGNADQLEQVVFSQHSGASSCSVGQFQQSARGGPIVYVANGSHASEPAAGNWATDVPGVNDFVYPDASLIPPVYPTVNVITASSPSWVAWPGLWGDSGSSPQGPDGPEHTQRFTDPQDWAAQADTCFSRQEAPGYATATRVQAHPAISRERDRTVFPYELRLLRPEATGRVLSVEYEASRRGRRPGPAPRLLARFSAPGALPRFARVREVAHRGEIRVYGHYAAGQRWTVEVSLLGRRIRSPLVERRLRWGGSERAR